MREIPFFTLHPQHHAIQREMAEVFDKIVRQGKFVLGDHVERFEKEFAVFQKVKHCVSVGNGHDALWIALKTYGIGKGDEVIVPSHTCQATWLAVVNTGARPVPVEVDPFNYLINPELIERSLSPKTKAIVPVHLYGHPCAMDNIVAIAKNHNLKVIEDNAQAHGAIYKSKQTGSWGDCNATSFYPTKNLGALGDGGAILTNNKKIADQARAIRNYGSVKKDIHTVQGINSRLDELQAALLSIKLKRLKSWNDQRIQNAKIYCKLLPNVGDLQLPPQPSASVKPVFHQFVIQTRSRNELRKYLAKKGIETAIHYPMPVHQQKAYDFLKYKKGSLPIAERLSETILSLPVWPGMKFDEIEFVSDEIQTFFRR
ncbi:MAG: DegT/DnrJ/EryC1/StrS family aminotransferase [Bacteroidetes bacterium]|nr:DegT/DnrJ/EryC1/StrS family aminotransferase [Bacteroidota bacterium]